MHVTGECCETDVVRTDPQRALQDLSVSLQLDSSIDNISCYLQRAVIYSHLDRCVSLVTNCITLGLLTFQNSSRLYGIGWCCLKNGCRPFETAHYLEK